MHERVLHSVPQDRGCRLGRSSEDSHFESNATYRRAGEVLNLSTTLQFALFHLHFLLMLVLPPTGKYNFDILCGWPIESSKSCPLEYARGCLRAS